MNAKHLTAKRPTWRDRFLEIAREAGGLERPAAAVIKAGLRPRAKMAGFATLRRTSR
jgi:hypothetical protein